uniref:Uncharacterized protein n=1 Tax=Avena sativa TaxID=4498 RepID=A0ACD5VVU3_AVESA
MPRPEVQAPPEIFYNESEARKYTTSSRIIEIQARISERALELLALPNDGVPKMLLDIGCGSGLSGETLTEHGHHWIGYDISESMLDVALERETEGDLLLADMGEGLGLRPGVIDGAISISAVQWLCNADKSSHEPRLRLKAFFGSLYRCLARGARAILQFYADNVKQTEMLVSFAMNAGFAGGVVVDWPHSSKARKSYLVLTCGAPSVHTSLPKAKGQDGQMCSSDDDGDDDDESNDDQTGDDNDRLRETARDGPIQSHAMNPEPGHHGSPHGTSKRKRVTRSKQPKRTKLFPGEEEEVISSSSSDEDI